MLRQRQRTSCDWIYAEGGNTKAADQSKEESYSGGGGPRKCKQDLSQIKPRQRQRSHRATHLLVLLLSLSITGLNDELSREDVCQLGPITVTATHNLRGKR